MANAQVDSDLEENVLNFDSNNVIEPYRFEPKTSKFEQIIFDEDDDSDTEPLTEQEEFGATNEPDNAWCSCTYCREMPTVPENRCCHYYSRMRDLIEHKHKCITEHIGFQGNCLNPYVLEPSVYEFVQREGPLGDDEPVNELMRYLAYRRLVRWVFGKLGKKNRGILPSCAVVTIREAYPSEFYHGFRFPIY